jgi:hypothetical protein
VKWETRRTDAWAAIPTAAMAWKTCLTLLCWMAMRTHASPVGELDPI